MYKKAYVFWFALLTALYVGMALFGPIDPSTLQKYHLTESRAQLLTLTIVVPLVLIWATALYGLVRFKNYAEVIKNEKEGRAFRDISWGLTFLAFNLPAGALVGSVATYLTLRHPNLIEETTIIRNYIRMIIPGFGLIYLARGASGLTVLLKKTRQDNAPRYNLFGIIMLSSVFSWLITTKAAANGGNVIYYLPNWLIITTLAIPYIYTWCKGISGVYSLLYYQKSIKGVIYKKFLNLLALGIATIIALSVLTQFLTTLSARLYRLNITPLLLIIYVLVALNALGYGWVARGARKLKQIEEV